MDGRAMLVMLVLVLVAAPGDGQRNRPGNRLGNRRRDRCPDPNSFGRNCFTYQDQCRSSRQCAGPGQKCCLVAGCGRECVDVAVAPPANEGSCPDPASYGRTCIQYFDQCQTAADCGESGACCLVAGCGKECLRPISVSEPKCPEPSGLAGICVIGPNSCYPGQECPAGKLCCPEGCGSECKDPV